MKLEQYIFVLKSMRLFKNLNESTIKELFKEIDYKIENYCKGDIIFTEDDKCNNLSIILEGNIEIQKIDALGKVLTVALFDAGETFGENLIFGDKNNYPMTVSSKTDSVVLHMQKSSVVKLCQMSSDFLYEYLRIISNRAISLSAKLREVTLKTIRQKICEFILNQYKLQNNVKISLPMTKKDLADNLGVQRPSLSRELIKMKEEELIDYDKDIIIIKNLEALEENL